MIEAIAVAALLLALVLVCLSFTVRSALGSFKPASVMLLIFSCYNVLPFLAVAAAPELAELMLLNSFTYYGWTNLLAVASLSLACVTAGALGLLTASLIEGRRQVIRHNLRIESDRLQARRLTLGAWVFATLLITAGLLLWNLRGFLFSGYHDSFGEDQNEVLLRGSLSSVFTLLFVSYIFTWFANEHPSKPLRCNRRLFWAMTLSLLMVGLALLSLGGRLYVISVVFTAVALQAVRLSMLGQKTGSRWKLLSLIGLLLGAVAGVGIWRTQSGFNGLALMVNLLSEPLFVSISLASLFDANTVPALAFPTFLISDAVGVLPSAIYPDKLERLFAINGTYRVESPVGGLSGLASLSINFGWLGAIVVSGLICFMVTRLSYIVARPRALPSLRVVYVIAVTFPLLSLCRDPFVISVYKNLFQNSLVLPLMLALSAQLVLKQRRSWHHRSDATQH